MGDETIQLVASVTEKLGIIGIVVMAWVFERRRADRLEAKLITSLEINQAKE